MQHSCQAKANWQCSGHAREHKGSAFDRWRGLDGHGLRRRPGGKRASVRIRRQSAGHRRAQSALVLEAGQHHARRAANGLRSLGSHVGGFAHRSQGRPVVQRQGRIRRDDATPLCGQAAGLLPARFLESAVLGQGRQALALEPTRGVDDGHAPGARLGSQVDRHHALEHTRPPVYRLPRRHHAPTG